VGGTNKVDRSSQVSGQGTNGVDIELRGIAHHYGEIPILHDIDLRIEPGEFLALLGPSGSGKTTTLNIIAGLVQPSAGRVLLGGRDVTGMSSRRHGLGIIFQNYALFPHLTVERNVMFPLKMRRVPKAEARQRARDALGMVRMGQLGNRLPSTLSGGEQQRVAFARAVVFNPPALLLDEPLSALDLHLREELQLEIKRMHRELGVTFVFVTHDQTEAMTLADRIAIFNNGTIEQIGRPEELYERPSSVYVARFLGESNLFNGTFVAGRHAYLRTEVGDLPVPIQEVVPNAGTHTLMIRPERLRILPLGEADSSASLSIGGRVEDIVYRGPARNVYISHVSGRHFIVREQAGGYTSIRPDDEVAVSWQIEDGVLISRHCRSVSCEERSIHALGERVSAGTQDSIQGVRTI
jgi:putative spermidine/putrescine transport system ATP-binding protein